MAERDARAVDVDDIAAAVVVRKAPAFHHGERLGREGFVQFDQADIVPAKPVFREQAIDRRHRADPHARRVAARCAPAVEPQDRFEAEFLDLVFRHHETGGGGIVLLAGIARRDDRILVALAVDGAQSAERLHAGIGAEAFVLGEHHRIAAPLRDFDRHQLIVEAARVPRGGGVPVGSHCEFIRSLARDAIVLGKVFGRLDHAGDDPEAFDRLAHQTPARQPVPQHHIAHARPVAGLGRIVLDIRHALDPARKHAVGDAGLDHHRRSRDRLQARAASPVELEAGNLDRHSRGQPAPASDRRRLAAAIALSEDDILDPLGIDAAALHQRLDDDRAQLTRLDGGERAEKRAHGGAQG